VRFPEGGIRRGLRYLGYKVMGFLQNATLPGLGQFPVGNEKKKYGGGEGKNGERKGTGGRGKNIRIWNICPIAVELFRINCGFNPRKNRKLGEGVGEKKESGKKEGKKVGLPT